jgi:hypothetical protein
MVKRLALIVLGAVLITLALSSVALAATPQDIYNDYIDNGKLDGTYTQEELEAYLNDATLHAYGHPTAVDELDLIVQEMLREEFPYTGFQIAIAVIVAIALIAGGFAIRHFTRSQKPQKS